MVVHGVGRTHFRYHLARANCLAKMSANVICDTYTLASLAAAAAAAAIVVSVAFACLSGCRWVRSHTHSQLINEHNENNN